MKRIARIAVAASLLVALGIAVSWLVITGGEANMAFARVADALDSLRSATYDLAVDATEESSKAHAKATGKGLFLAPSRQRMEISVEIADNPAVKAAAEAARRQHGADSSAVKAVADAAAQAVKSMPEMKMAQVVIADSRAARTLMLMPGMKIAMAMDTKKMYEDMKKKSAFGAPPDMFELVRRLVREGNSGTGDKAERLGKKEIDGRTAVGFRTNSPMGDMTLWADPETARPIRIEVSAEMCGKVRMVMNNFHYDVDLDPSLFSLEPPAGYMTQTISIAMPVEEDLLRTLRIVAEHGKGLFPAKFGMNKEVMEAASAGLKTMTPAMDKDTQAKLDTEMKKLEAKYGGKEKLRAKYGSKLPPEIMAEFMKATMPIMQEQARKQMQDHPEQIQLMQDRIKGLSFYMMLKPENDAHYAGGGVKLGTPNKAILWYKPTGSEKYRVIYADLSVKEMTAEEVKKLAEAKGK